ncbi:MAG: glycosidase, partial [Clostridiales bacterium]|nr:glycosidase [Clostridiales bacterium]
MKIKRIACALCAALLAFCLPLFGCDKDKGGKFRDDGTLNIIDDNNRNWYEVFVRSYCDSDNDGVGDFNGLTQKLGYIADLGFNGIWLMPVCQSDTYHGYDVKDYKTVESDYGTNADCKAMIAAAHEKGINVIVDMVFNHTSVAHPWYQRA